ncbi:MAG: hypothetical protein GX066_00455 [Clostridiaceae bacterium]|nr:hypothetical protein [Clostridiaceae bacterium]
MSRVIKSFQVTLGIPYSISQPVEAENEMKVKQEDLESVYIDKYKAMLEDAAKKSEEIINDARERAKKILMDAEKQSREMSDKLFREAREKGYDEGYREAERKARSILDEAEEIRRQAQERYNLVLDSAEQDIIQLILDISRKVIGDELDSRPGSVGLLVREALMQLKGIKSVDVYVSDEDYEAVCAAKELIAKESSYYGEIDIQKDSSLKKGSCIIESASGIIDCSVETQLGAIEKAFNDLLNIKKEG